MYKIKMNNIFINKMISIQSKILLFIFILFGCCNFCVCIEYLHKCGVYEDDIKPKAVKGKPFNNSSITKRKLVTDSNGFKDLNIYFDPTNIKKEVITYNLTDYLDMFLNSIQKAIDTLQKLVKIKPLKYIHEMNALEMVPTEVGEWDKEMFGNGTKDITFNDLDYDLVIFGRFYDPGPGSTTLASAGAYRLEYDDGRPFIGRLNINYKTDYSKGKSQEYLESILLHEFTHILGFSNWYFTNYFNNVFWKLDIYGINRTYINSSKVLEVGRKYFDCPDLDGIALEEYGGTGTVGSHWEARILLGDYMNGYTHTEEQVISEFTLALLEDTGYYKVNYYTGGLMRYGKHKGCEFLREICVNKTTHTINPYFENEFYDSIQSFYMDASCSSGRQSRTYYAWWTYSNLESEYSHYIYFNNTSYGGYGPADYCPVALKSSTEEKTTHYTGHCSEKGNGLYGSNIYYYDTNYGYRTFSNGNLSSITGEIFSDNSFCFLSSSIKKGTENIDIYTQVHRAICYKIFCSEKSLTVQIHDDFIVCPRSGGKIEIEGYEGYFLCPDYNLMCSGTVICNDMFDCVDKKSEVKESSYIYDYEIKTSQNTEDIETKEADNTYNYELSENAVCPINCKQCKENQICIKCRNDLELVANSDNGKIECLEHSQVEIGYYKNENNVYFKCINNCDECSDSETCEKCSDNFEYRNNKCVIPIENCKEYDTEVTCSKCNNNYAFEKTLRNTCININSFSEFYTKDDGISYYPCDEDITNCYRCNYSKELSKPVCTICKNNYILLESENKCYSKETIGQNKSFLYIDETKAKKCSEEIENCNECENKDKCIKCMEDYYLFNEDNKTCFGKLEIPIDNCYLNDEKTTYYLCNDTRYNSIDNCEKCMNKESCSLCKNGYTFINKDKTICIDKKGLEGKYIQDKDDKSNYIKCSNVFDNCDKCNDNFCNECKEEYIFIDENYLKCVEKKSIDLELYYTNDNKTYYSCKNNDYSNDERCKQILEKEKDKEEENNSSKDKEEENNSSKDKEEENVSSKDKEEENISSEDSGNFINSASFVFFFICLILI